MSSGHDLWIVSLLLRALSVVMQFFRLVRGH